MKRRGIYILFTLVFLLQAGNINGQLDCGSELSKAEKTYLTGQINDISSTLCDCMGIYLKVGKEGPSISQRRYRLLINGLQDLEKQGKSVNLGNYAYISDTLRVHAMFAIKLRDNPKNGSYIKGKKHNAYFSDYKTTIKNAERTPIGQLKLNDSTLLVATNNNAYNFKPFSVEQKFRAYSLLGQIYYQLGSYDMAEFVATRMIYDFPAERYQDEANLGFKSIHDQLKKRTARYSGGILIGWQYYFPVQIQNKTDKVVDFQYIPGGNLLLGAHINYILNESFTFSAWFYGNRNEIEYRLFEPDNNHELSILLKEEQVWYKLPITASWFPKKGEIFTSREDLEGKLFLRAGLSANFLYKSEGLFYAAELDQLVVDVDLIEYRRRANAEVMAGIGARMRFGRSYFSFSANAMHSILFITKTYHANPNNLYNILGIGNVNYRSATLFWRISYEWQFSKVFNTK